MLLLLLLFHRKYSFDFSFSILLRLFKVRCWFISFSWKCFCIQITGKASKSIRQSMLDITIVIVLHLVLYPSLHYLLIVKQTWCTIELWDESHSLRLSVCMFLHPSLFLFMLILLYLLYNLKDFFFVLQSIFFFFVFNVVAQLCLLRSIILDFFWNSRKILEVVVKKYLYPWTKLKNRKVQFKMGIPQQNIHSTKYMSYLSIFFRRNIYVNS